MATTKKKKSAKTNDKVKPPKKMAAKKTAAKKTAAKKAANKQPGEKGKRKPGTKPKPKAPKKGGGGKGKPVVVEAAESGKLDPFEVAKQTMKGSVPEIVSAMVEKAKQGSCTHAKTLLELTGAKHMFEGEAESHGGEPWAKLVLERLDEAESGSGEETVSGEAESVRVEAE